MGGAACAVRAGRGLGGARRSGKPTFRPRAATLRFPRCPAARCQCTVAAAFWGALWNAALATANFTLPRVVPRRCFRPRPRVMDGDGHCPRAFASSVEVLWYQGDPRSQPSHA